jgi:hypothetical protein
MSCCGERNGSAVLTAEQVRQIYKLALEGSWTQREIGEEFGVSHHSVWNIRHRRKWRHLWEWQTPTLTEIPYADYNKGEEKCPR